jgi:hypothetical protein
MSERNNTNFGRQILYHASQPPSEEQVADRLPSFEDDYHHNFPPFGANQNFGFNPHPSEEINEEYNSHIKNNENKNDQIKLKLITSTNIYKIVSGNQPLGTL